MQATVLSIQQKVKTRTLEAASITDFQVRPEESQDARTILENPSITLYCLDDEHRQAIFVETPPEIDLTDFPFYYQAQYQHAQRLFVVSYDVFHQLAEQYGERFQNLILIHSVGRCGSTLLSRAFNRLDSVVSLGEPDVYTQLTEMRPSGGARDKEIVQLIQSCTRLLYKPTRSGAGTLALKFRSFTIEIGDLLHAAFPRAKTLFLYRNAETWARSSARAFNVLDPAAPQWDTEAAAKNPKIVERTIPLLPPYVKRYLRKELSARAIGVVVFLRLAKAIPFLSGRVPTPAQYLKPYFRSFPAMKALALMWLSVMQRYLELTRQGVTMLAVQYETLVSVTVPTLRAILEYCGLPGAQAEIAGAAFAEDSQKGTPLAQDRLNGSGGPRVTEGHLAQVREVLREYPTVRVPDFVVPNTLTPVNGG